ncbi:very short patch repair endonuclease [Mycolicibacterium fluoranthenivorans]|uniref:very short patch repair endonuclease n=1 Tax=Mycolicibacterium fluoranthenivorans TaxID=258505 RepID=UPI0014240AAA|nr:very short patch repair endonuclease [Mycolicibacterium fluoranthenivorans]
MELISAAAPALSGHRRCGFTLNIVTDSWASSAGVRASMRANRRRDTLPELAVRRLVHAAGLRYRVDFAPLTSNRRLKADLVFTRARLAVFIDGCFWHGCPRHHTVAKRNAEFWAKKVTTNRARDERVNSVLNEAGWIVLRFWEHEDPTEVAAQIVETVRFRPQWRRP